MRPSAALCSAVVLAIAIGPFALGSHANAAAATTVTLRATDDSAVEEAHPTANYGGAVSVTVDGSPKTEVFLRFDPSSLSGSLATAHLRLYVIDKTANGPQVWTTSSFAENSLTWANRPAPVMQLANLGAVTSGAWLDIDVSGALGGPGPMSFVLVADSTDGMDFRTDEASSNRPQLVVQTSDSTTTTSSSSTSSSSTSSSSTSSSSTSSSSTSSSSSSTSSSSTSSTSTSTTTTLPPSGDPFAIALIGDTGYDSTAESNFLVTRTSINNAGVAFTTHVGDIWSGAKPCPQSRYDQIRSVFNGFDAPLVYTPGDNETTDCVEDTASRLAMVRSTFFPTNQTLGAHTFGVTRQPGFPENARFTKGGIVFATMDEPGPSGASGSLGSANLAWLDAAFDQAEADGAPAVMVMWQDNSFAPAGGPLATRLKARTAKFKKPVVLVHGDTHSERVDHPWADLPNFTRVEVFGGTPPGKWVKANVNPSSAGVFSFSVHQP